MIDCDKETMLISADKLFYTIEGEGEYIGYPSVFMRLAMCNLTCSAFASEDSPHGCDSFVSWSVKNKMTFNDIFQYMEDNDLVSKLKASAILKITGGEPMIQQKKLLIFIKAFIERYEFTPVIDFETNATLIPSAEWLEYGATFTTSPKLSTNGDPESKTYNPKALNWHIQNKSGFKFVITCSEDIDEIWRKYVTNDDVKIPLDRVWFMPCCGSQKEHLEKGAAVAEYAKALGVKFSPRLQLVLWDMALLV